MMTRYSNLLKGILTRDSKTPCQRLRTWGRHLMMTKTGHQIQAMKVVHKEVIEEAVILFSVDMSNNSDNTDNDNSNIGNYIVVWDKNARDYCEFPFAGKNWLNMLPNNVRDPLKTPKPFSDWWNYSRYCWLHKYVIKKTQDRVDDLYLNYGIQSHLIRCGYT